MGKNKQKKKDAKRKDQSVFKVAGAKVQKSKNKTKAVTTNLKKINLSTKSKTENADAALKDVHSKITNKQAKVQKKPNKKACSQPTQAPVDVDAAMEDLSKL